MNCPETPECDKLAKARSERLLILRFIEWLQEQKKWLAEEDGFGELHPISKSGDSVVMDFLGIDARKLEAERSSLLDYQRQLNMA